MKSRNKSGKRPVLGAMTLIGGLLVLSALLRLPIGVGAAMALEKAKSDGHSEAAETTEAPHKVGLSAEDIQPILDALKKREARVDERERALDIRAKALQMAEDEVNRNLAALEQAEERLRETLALAQTAAEDDLTRLTDVYASMKPKQAAALFEEMDPEFAAGFLGRMRPDAAGAIMAGLTPTAAYTISVTLAGRNAEVPKE